MLQRSILEAPAASSNADSRNAGSRSWLNPPVDESSGRLSVSSAPKSWHRPCHGGGTEDAGPLKEKKQRKIATMDRLGLNLVARMKTHKKWSVYDERAMNLDRIRMVISGCSCKAACTSMFTEEEAMQICSAFYTIAILCSALWPAMMKVNSRPTLPALSTVILSKVSRSTAVRTNKIKQFGTSWAELFASVASVLSLA